ncbi:hypothetical protein V5O48_012061, partial [Marasmius crinis-equi]
VSAAIVVRSLLLRRRHRRMIEEAIRNGTYVPPANAMWDSGRGGRGQVDLGRKPVMWEAWLGGGYTPGRREEGGVDLGLGVGEKGYPHPHPHPLEGGEKGRDVEWGGIMPMSLQLLKQPVYIDLTNPNASTHSLNNSSRSRNGSRNQSSTSLPNNTANSNTGGFLGRLRTTFGWRSSSSHPAPSLPATSATTSPSDSPNPPPSVPPGVGVGIVPPWARLSAFPDPRSYLPASQAGQPRENLPPQVLWDTEGRREKEKEKARVRVSVMIAMPSRHPVISSAAKVQQGQQGQVEVEEELPHLEVGSVEVDVEGGCGEEEREGEREEVDEKEKEAFGEDVVVFEGKGKRSMSGNGNGAAEEV